MSDPNGRRAAERFPVNADTSCSFLAPVVEDFRPAKILNLSMEGIGLLVSRPVDAGSLLAVTLENRARGFSRTVLVRVVHSTPQLGSYLVGGTLCTPLPYPELTTLVM
jgi:hypothetical protein